MYAKGHEVTHQATVRAELLAFIKGLLTVQTQTDDDGIKIMAHTDSEHVKRAVTQDLIIDTKLNNKLEEIMNCNCTIDVRCIDRSSNALPDAIAKVGRSNGRIEIGSLDKPIQ